MRLAGEGLERLSAAGFEVRIPRSFEANEVFDTAGGGLRAARKLLRLRQFRETTLVTYKGPPEEGPHKRREEIELPVLDAPAARDLLERLGFLVVFRYEKYRTVFERTGEAGHAVLDETPIGDFLELEGSPAWIDSATQELGFRNDEQIRESYGSLYRSWCHGRGEEPGDMLFSRPKSST